MHDVAEWRLISASPRVPEHCALFFTQSASPPTSDFTLWLFSSLCSQPRGILAFWGAARACSLNRLYTCFYAGLTALPSRRIAFLFFALSRATESPGISTPEMTLSQTLFPLPFFSLKPASAVTHWLVSLVAYSALLPLAQIPSNLSPVTGPDGPHTTCDLHVT